jgi:hypothetical protein
MIAVLIAILLAALAYWLCIALGLPCDRGAHRRGAGAAGRCQPARPTLVAAACSSCAECGALSDQARCPLHRRGANAHWSKGRDRTAQDKFRKALIRMYGMRCAAVVDGVRCPVTTGLQAHHTQPGNDDPRTGALLCTEHHRAVDAHAR